MADGRFVSYLRVSTDRQGRSGLGLEAQRAAVADYLNGGQWKLVAEVVEVESGKRDDNRPELQKAFNLCRAHRATLVIAKLDRLSRDAGFLLNLQKEDIEFVACDMPHIKRFELTMRAGLSEEERRLISERTKAALAAAKARGTKLGGSRGRVGTADDTAKARARRIEKAAKHAIVLAPIIAEVARTGIVTLNGIAAALNERGVPTATGKGEWTAAGVARVKARAGSHSYPAKASR